MELNGHSLPSFSSSSDTLETPEPALESEREPESPQPRTEPAYRPAAAPKYPTLGYE